MRIVKIRLDGSPGWLALKADMKSVLDSEELEIHLSDAEVGDALVFEIAEMPEEEFRNLPEFDGF